MKRFLYLMFGLVLAVSVSACAGLGEAPPPPSGDQVSFNTNKNFETTGLTVLDPTTMRPLFVLGQVGYSEGETPAVYVSGETAPLQAQYVQRRLPDGTVELDVRDGNTNCTGLDLRTSAETVTVTAGLEKTFCMGVGGQDLAIGLAGAPGD